MGYYHKTGQTPKEHGSLLLASLCLILALTNAFFPIFWPYAQKCPVQSPCYPWVTFIILGVNILALGLIIILSLVGYRKLKLPHNHQQLPVAAKILFAISLIGTALLCLYHLILEFA